MPSPSLLEILKSFRWSHEPAHWSLNSVLEFRTEPHTDYWQRTHYGFQPDNGHFFHTTLQGDFTVAAFFTWEPGAQYDQCGLMCRVDSDTWIKCSTEYETHAFGRLGSVVTNLGFSDWATQDFPGPTTSMHYKLNRRGDDFLLAWATDGRDWQQMRVTHLHRCPPQLEVGIYACSPLGSGFVCRLTDLAIGPNDWIVHA